MRRRKRRKGRRRRGRSRRFNVGYVLVLNYSPPDYDEARVLTRRNDGID